MIRDAIKISKIHLERFERATDEIKSMGKLEDVDIENFEIIKTIDTFIFRFMKLQDYMGYKLFKSFLIETGDYRDDMSFIDMLDKLEKLKIIDSAENWIKLRKLRNKLAHEYPDELEEILADIKEALKWSSYFKNVLLNMITYLKKRGKI
ncbi:hypothetical protein JCM12298_07310 [Desulfothermus naphthae]